MQYGFSVAKELYEKGQHPRLLCSSTDIDRIKGQITSGHGLTLFNGLKQRVQASIDHILSSDNLPETLDSVGKGMATQGGLIAWALHDMALYAVLSEAPDAIEAVKRVFKAAPETGDPDITHYRMQFAINAGRNMGYAYDLMENLLDEETKSVFCPWMLTQIKNTIDATRKTHYVSAGGNIPIFYVVNMLIPLLAMKDHPSVGDMEEEQAELFKMYEASLYGAIGKDGWPAEEIGYGSLTVTRLLQVGEVLRRAGIYDLYNKCARMKKFGHACLASLQPWGKDLTNLGDIGDVFGTTGFSLPRLAEELDAPELLWLSGELTYDMSRIHKINHRPDIDREVMLTDTFRQQPTFDAFMMLHMMNPPKRDVLNNVPTQFCDRTRGIAFFRSDWQDDLGTYVTLDGSQRPLTAQGHQHASSGHFCLSAVGEYFSINCGRYNIDQDCHSVMLVNGKSGRTTNGEWRHTPYPGIMTNYEPGEIVDTASVDSAHQHNCYVAKRHLFFIKGEGARHYVIAIDNMNANDDWNEFWWQMQTSPENTIELREAGATITGWQQGNKLDVELLPVPLAINTRPTTIEMAQDIKEYSSYKYYKKTTAELESQYKRPSDMVHGPCYRRPRLIGKVTAPSGDIMAVMTPRLKDEAAAKVTQFETVPGSIGAIIEHDKVIDTFIYAYEHGILEGNGVTARGRWCLVRRDKESGKVIHQELGDGNFIEVE
jgi:hypothetical protein